MKIGCVIQGDMRRGSNLVIEQISKLFDITILSTWEEDKDLIPLGDFEVVLNQKPTNIGFGNRNLLRKTSAEGVKKAILLGCDYILKWRTDMLPTALNIDKLMEYTSTNLPYGISSRIATLGFRNLSVRPDWFSSMPDLFHFGHKDMMEMLWGDDAFDYTLDMNIPMEMIEEVGTAWVGSTAYKLKDPRGIWCNESELYSIFKSRLQKRLGLQLTHPLICKDYFRLFDHNCMKIVWFGQTEGYRPIFQGWHIPWWTEKGWLNNKYSQIGMGYPLDYPLGYIRKKLSPLINKKNLFMQKRWHMEFNGGLI